MTTEPLPPHLRLVAETDEETFARRRAADELSLALRQLTANLMRLARGSGRSDDLASQCIAVLDALEGHMHVVGREPKGSEIAGLLAFEAVGDGQPLAAWEMAERVVVRGALQMAASGLLHQTAQASAGRSQLFEGVIALEKLRARHEPEAEVLQQALDALDEVIGESAGDDDHEDDLSDPGTFLVREREGGGFLGIFAAETAADLWDMVDAHDDPFRYEFLRVENGGILFETRPALNRCPDDEGEALDWEGPFPGALITTDELMDGVLDNKDVDWEPFDAADVGVGLIARVGRMLEDRDNN